MTVSLPWESTRKADRLFSSASASPQWFWGTEESMRAHHRGIKELLRLCGGISGLIDPVHSSIMLL